MQQATVYNIFEYEKPEGGGRELKFSKGLLGPMGLSDVAAENNICFAYTRNTEFHTSLQF